MSAILSFGMVIYIMMYCIQYFNKLLTHKFSQEISLQLECYV